MLRISGGAAHFGVFRVPRSPQHVLPNILSATLSFIPTHIRGRSSHGPAHIRGRALPTIHADSGAGRRRVPKRQGSSFQGFGWCAPRMIGGVACTWTRIFGGGRHDCPHADSGACVHLWGTHNRGRLGVLRSRDCIPLPTTHNRVRPAGYGPAVSLGLRAGFAYSGAGPRISGGVLDRARAYPGALPRINGGGLRA